MAAEQPRHALLGHDERPGPVRRRRPTVVRHVANPLTTVPGDTGARRLPGPPVGVCRRPVVEDAPVERPTKRPAVVHPEPRGIGGVPPRHHVAFLGVAAGVDPVARGRGAIGSKLAE